MTPITLQGLVVQFSACYDLPYSRVEILRKILMTIFFKRKEKRTGKIKRFFGNGPGAVSGETGTSVRGAFEADERSKKDRGKEKSGT